MNTNDAVRLTKKGDTPGNTLCLQCQFQSLSRTVCYFTVSAGAARVRDCVILSVPSQLSAVSPSRCASYPAAGVSVSASVSMSVCFSCRPTRLSYTAAQYSAPTAPPAPSRRTVRQPTTATSGAAAVCTYRIGGATIEVSPHKSIRSANVLARFQFPFRRCCKNV